MPGTYSQILLHAVYSTKDRKSWITADIAERLYPFIGGIVRDKKGTLLAIGGIEDHVHMYYRWQTDLSIATLMREVKAGSSEWIHKTFPKLAGFAWQEGYGVFSVSKSQEPKVVSYIHNQEELSPRVPLRSTRGYKPPGPIRGQDRTLGEYYGTTAGLPGEKRSS